MQKTASLVALLLALSPLAHAVPSQLTTQGRLLDTDGEPVDDSLEITFRLLDSETGGSTLWEEEQTVSLTNGFYSVILGADEADNPLEDAILDQWPLWLEVQVTGQPAMSPRMSVSSVPFARMAGVANELSPGASIDAESLSVNGAEVVGSDGTWTGATPSVSWTELLEVPAGFADDDDADTLARLVCADRQWAVYDATKLSWYCDGFADTTRTDADVISVVEDNLLDLYAGSTMDGAVLLTEGDAIEWGWLIDVPPDLDDGDDDTLSSLGCSDGEIAVYSSTDGVWQCGTDTDTRLTGPEVIAAVEAASSLALPSDTTVGGDDVITTTSTVAWSQLSPVPTGLADGDDDTLGALSCTGTAIPIYSGSAWTCGTDTDTTLTTTEVVDAVNAASAVAMTGTLSVGGYAVLTENSNLDWSKLTGVPTGLDDGDDDTLADLACADGEVAAYDSSTGWGCLAASGGSGTATSLYRMAAGCVASDRSTTTNITSGALLTLSATCTTLQCYSGYNSCGGGCVSGGSRTTCSNVLQGTILLQ
jgi:hypothetical protein